MKNGMPTIDQMKKELARRRELRTVTITDKNKEKKINIPDYGEIRIVCHDGNIKIIEVLTKEQF